MRQAGFSRLVADIFGEIQGVNFVAPQWWVEGVAVYAETELTASGRGRNPYERMRLASNLLSEHPWSLGQIGVPTALSLPWDRVYLAGYPLIAESGEAPVPLDLDRRNLSTGR